MQQIGLQRQLVLCRRTCILLLFLRAATSVSWHFFVWWAWLVGRLSSTTGSITATGVCWHFVGSSPPLWGNLFKNLNPWFVERSVYFSYNIDIDYMEVKNYLEFPLSWGLFVVWLVINFPKLIIFNWREASF